jgi:anti-sigma factor RsiW
MNISEKELHAFIDGEIDPERAAEITTLLASDADLAARIAAFRSDQKRLEQVYGTLVDRELPSEWVRRIEARERPQRSFAGVRVSRRAFAALAASLLILAGAWLALANRSGPGADAIITEALAARREAMRPAQIINVANAGASEAPNQVLTSALTMKLKAPDLSKIGYRLADVRIYSGVPGGNAVELRYRDQQARLFTLYLRHPSSPARVDLSQRDGLRICIWQDDIIGTVMVGDMSAGEMARAASAAYAGLNL